MCPTLCQAQGWQKLNTIAVAKKVILVTAYSLTKTEVMFLLKQGQFVQKGDQLYCKSIKALHSPPEEDYKTCKANTFQEPYS
jgi:hypothetical protein